MLSKAGEWSCTYCYICQLPCQIRTEESMESQYNSHYLLFVRLTGPDDVCACLHQTKSEEKKGAS